MSNLGTPTKFGTFWVLLAAASVLIGWDIYAAVSPDQPTISALILHYSHKYMSIPYAAGALSGHLWWPQIVKEDKP